MNIINKQTVIRMQIPKEEFDKEIHLSLGNKNLVLMLRYIDRQREIH